ncbi:MAG: hypothetical protein IBJ10_10060, partial [Phycisphaerales bacterium]|nr:hypothetical protein [Phycisphaerales bacterium]
MTTNQPIRLDPARCAPEWAATVALRGAEIPLRSPLEVEQDEHGTPRGGLLWAPVNLALALARAAFGVRALPRLRAVCRDLTTPPYRPLVSAMSGGELALMYHLYLGAQREWLTAAAAGAARSAAAQREAAAPERGGRAARGPGAVAPTAAVPGAGAGV